MLPFSLTLRAGEPVVDQVVYAVTRAVVSGQLRAGDRFPSVRALSQELKVNPNTAQRIVTLLVEGGLLAVEQGIGTVVTTRGAGKGAGHAAAGGVAIHAARGLAPTACNRRPGAV